MIAAFFEGIIISSLSNFSIKCSAIATLTNAQLDSSSNGITIIISYLLSLENLIKESFV